MAKRHSLAVEVRTAFGNKVKQLRRDGLIPANIYGNKVEPVAISVETRPFQAVFRAAGETGLIDLALGEDKQTRPVLVQSLQRDPVTGTILHIDFHQVNLKEKLTAMVPLDFVGESDLVKNNEGMLLELLQEVEVESLPTEIPSSIEVDTAAITEMDGGIFVRDLKLPEGVEMKTDLDEMVCKVGAAQMSEVEDEEVSTAETLEEVGASEDASGNE
jgi:large subunit ribosomal protein L25